MNKKMKIVLILGTYAILAVIPSVLGYLQYDGGKSTQYDSGSCGTCHVVPLCMTCHDSKVHEYQKKYNNESFDCNSCHGFPPIVPVTIKDRNGSLHNV